MDFIVLDFITLLKIKSNQLYTFVSRKYKIAYFKTYLCYFKMQLHIFVHIFFDRLIRFPRAVYPVLEKVEKLYAEFPNILPGRTRLTTSAVFSPELKIIRDKVPIPYWHVMSEQCWIWVGELISLGSKHSIFFSQIYCNVREILSCLGIFCMEDQDGNSCQG